MEQKNIKVHSQKTRQKTMVVNYLPVDTLIIVDTNSLICENDGVSMRKRSTTILSKAVLSKTTTQSALWVSLFKVNSEFYGCTTTSLTPTAEDKSELFS